MTTAVSALWLTPKLAQFWRAHGDVSVAQMVSDTAEMPGKCDLSIHYGDVTKESGSCRVLFHDRIMALGSPAFARAHAVSSVAELARLPLIHLDSGWTGWEEWLAAFGHRGPLRGGHRVNNYIIALQAACDDMGAVLGWTGLTRGYLDNGSLMPLLAESVEPREDFYIKLHPHPTARARLVHDWLVADTG